MTAAYITRLADLQPERPVAALVAGVQVVVVRLVDDRVFVVGQHDPFSGANVMSRGIVGSILRGDEEIPTLQSPMYKQAFDLRTGHCLGEVPASLGVWEVTVIDGGVFVGTQRADAEATPLAEAS